MFPGGNEGKIVLNSPGFPRMLAFPPAEACEPSYDLGGNYFSTNTQHLIVFSLYRESRDKKTIRSL